ncbi:MAG: DUF2177 family protein [Candidatus Dojkabacteria bacterium]
MEIELDLIDYVIVYFIAVFVFFAIDLVWLSVIAKEFYKKFLGKIMRKNEDGNLSPRWLEAFVFYLIYIAGIVVFPLREAIQNDDLILAGLLGGLFGLFCYATYDLTNRATLEHFPLKVVIVDIIWGSLLTTLVSSLTAFIFLSVFL